MEKTRKHFYATSHRYGISFCNDYDMLYRFSSKAERDSFVEDLHFHEASLYGGYRTEAITRSEARRHFPNAFRILEYHDEADERDWHDTGSTYEYWHSSNLDE